MILNALQLSVLGLAIYIAYAFALWYLAKKNGASFVFYLVLALPQALGILWLSLAFLVLVNITAFLASFLLIILLIVIAEIIIRGHFLVDAVSDDKKRSFVLILVLSPFVGWLLYWWFKD